ncbi:MAG: redoxin domain-containing protein [Alphaproteobacteria bacterium]|nr:MAG: redoxin domain-containing protein [Caulobacteraceae bacterium]TPW08573.1 MAG: redoxin domain-containing protein [Alphaproteobacteria bacterium]
MAANAKTRPLALRVAGWLALVGLLAAVYVLFTAVSKPADSGYARFAKGAMVNLVTVRDPPPQPLTRFANAAGTELSLADFRGRVTLVNLWASWCAPCIEEMPTLAALQEAYPKEQFAVAAISIDRRDMAARARDDLKKLSGDRLAFYNDPSSAIAYEMKARGMPTSVLYARDGREIARLSGAANWSSPEARALIDAALAE